MNITRRRGTIATFITMGVMLVGLAVALNVGWIILNERNVALAVLGIIFFAILIAGVVLNIIFLVREVRRNERQDSFLNAVTHELKTPIASIRLYLETLQRRPVDEANRQEFYRIMHSDSDRLLATVEQVLKAGEQAQRRRKAERTIIQFEPLVAECIAVTLQRHHLPATAIVLEPVPGAVKLPVSGNLEDLRTAVSNLLDNAVKYSPGNVHVRCRLAIVGYTSVALTIEDKGVGIPSAHLKRIFHRFYRVPGRSMVTIKGTGLGLFIVRSIARQHGGDATADSPGPGLGTTMTLRLPLANSQSSSPETAAHDLDAPAGLVKGTASAVPSDRA
jgi:two-component system sensor histidine kinase SenX3